MGPSTYHFVILALGGRPNCLAMGPLTYHFAFIPHQRAGSPNCSVMGLLTYHSAFLCIGLVALTARFMPVKMSSCISALHLGGYP